MKSHLIAITSLAAAVVLTACNPLAPPISEDASAESPSGSTAGAVAPSPTVVATVPMTTAPTTSTIPPTTPTQPPLAQSFDFPGDVAPGHVRFGAAIDGNGDPVVRHESTTDRAMGIRRTFWRWDQRVTSMIKTAKADLAAGRLPWVSVKTPGWAAMASGSLDGEIDQMIVELNKLDGPVWLTVHHEPEGGGGIVGPDDPAGAPAWRAMQSRVRQRINTIGTSNIAFAPILMTWTFDTRSNRNPSEWWVDGIWDFAGVDHYVDKESDTTFELTMWKNMRAFYTAKKLKIAVAEWGNRGSDAQSAKEVQDFYNMAIASGSSAQSQVIGLSAFDSNLNSPRGGWELKGDQLAKFRELMSKPTSVLRTSSGS